MRGLNKPICRGLALLLITLCLNLSCNQNTENVSIQGFALDTSIKIKIYGTRNNKILAGCLNEIEYLESKLSIHNENSEIFSLSEHAGEGWQDISTETEEVLNASKYYGTLSSGKLDVTAGPLIDLWNIAPPNGHVPTEAELISTLPLLGLEDLEISRGKARLLRKDMKLNLGAVAKGFIADKTKQFLIEQGVQSGIINLGGNILVLGSKPGDQPFRIGIQDPLSQRGENIGILEIRDSSMVTSGDYERFFMDSNGNKYHHILDPQGGYPAVSGLHQVTIVSKTSLEGDALSTSLFILGLEKSMELLKGMEGVEAIFVTTDKEVFITKGLKERFQFTAEQRGYRLISP